MLTYTPTPRTLVVLSEYQGSLLVGMKRVPKGKKRRLPWEGGPGTFEVEVEQLQDTEDQVGYITTTYKISFDRLFDVCLYFGLPRDDIDHGGGSFKKTPYSSERRINTIIVTNLLSPGLPWCVPVEEDSTRGFLPREVIEYLLEYKRRETTAQFILPKYRVCLTRTIIGTARPKKRKLPPVAMVSSPGEMSCGSEGEEDI